MADYRENGAASLAHVHRGRRPANAIPEATKSRVVHLARTIYQGVNHAHLSELLGEREGIDIGRTTLRRILVSAAEQSQGKTPAKTPGAPSADAPRGYAGPT